MDAHADTPTPETAPSSAERNQAYYDQTSAGQEDYWRKMAAPRFRVRTVLSLLRQIAPSTVVDLGCGGGQLLHEVAAATPGARLTGIDISPRQMDLNQARWPEVSWRVANLDAPATFEADQADQFDAVVAMEIIEHLDHPAVFLANARALARPHSGQLVLSTQSGPMRETERRVGHKQHFTAAEMSRLLEEAGWEPLRVWNAGFPFHDLSKWYANRNPDASMKQFGEQSYGLYQNAVCLALRGLFRLNSNHRGAQLFALARRR
jgi:2-polyprenyl-3-methyl-5-hydroxy-6-metoxy-1,4-benzoquinol methylase